MQYYEVFPEITKDRVLNKCPNLTMIFFSRLGTTKEHSRVSVTEEQRRLGEKDQVKTDSYLGRDPKPLSNKKPNEQTMKLQNASLKYTLLLFALCFIDTPVRDQLQPCQARGQ